MLPFVCIALYILICIYIACICIYCIASHRIIICKRVRIRFICYSVQNDQVPTKYWHIRRRWFSFYSIHVWVCHACAINRSKDILSAYNCDHISNGWQPQPIQLSITEPVLTSSCSSSTSFFTLVLLLLFLLLLNGLLHIDFILLSLYVVWLLHIWQAFKNLL